MLVVKDLRVNERGAPLFEKVNLVIRPGERIGVVGSVAGDVTIFLRVLAGELDSDEGKVLVESERVVYVSPDVLGVGGEALAQTLHTRPTFLFLDAGVDAGSAAVTDEVTRFVRGYRGGMLIASGDANLMRAAQTTRVFELHAATRKVSSYTGSYDSYAVEREKNEARMREAYEKQQKEKRRLEGWLEQKREEASISRSPERGATIRAKVKYLQREILDKEIPHPILPEE